MVAEECTIIVRTLGGSEFVMDGLSPTMTLIELKERLSERVRAPPFALKLVAGDCMLDEAQTLREAGLAVLGASVVMVRCCQSSDVSRLFRSLVHAINLRQPQVARRLVDQGAGLDGDGNILRAGNQMMRPGDYIASPEEPGNTMLHLAIRERLTDLSLYLIARGTDINATNDAGRGPLLQAVLKKSHAVVQALLAAGADVNQRDYNGHTALTHALRQGNDQLAAQLITAGSRAYEDLQHDFLGLASPVPEDCLGPAASPVLWCCAASMALTAQALLTAGAPVGEPDVHGRTALHYASSRNLPLELLDALAARGADTAEGGAHAAERGADAAARDNEGFLPAEVGFLPAEVACLSRPWPCFR